jgi:hypothetical protein
MTGTAASRWAIGSGPGWINLMHMAGRGARGQRGAAVEQPSGACANGVEFHVLGALTVVRDGRR